MSRAVLSLCALVIGCSQPEQVLWFQSGDSPGMPADPATLEDLEARQDGSTSWIAGQLDVPGLPGVTETIDEPAVEFEMALEAVLQRNRWGRALGRCQIEVAFRIKNTGEVDGNGGPSSDMILIPEDYGSCAYTDLAPAESRGAEVSLTDEDDWELSGTISGADAIYLHSATTTLTLPRVNLSDGGVRYELTDCSEADFPFGQIFDLEVPSLEGASIPGFYVEEALAVGPDVWLLEPMVSRTEEVLIHPTDQSIVGIWEDLGPSPRVLGDVLAADRVIFLRNHLHGETMPFEALACRPPDRQMTISPESLAPLRANPDPVLEDYYIAYQVDTVFKTPSFEAPWGQSVFARSTVSESGEVHLYTAD